LSRTPRDRLIDIRDAARDLLDFVGTMESEAFHALPATDRMAHRAVKNALVEIGDRHPGVDWRGFSGLRDVVSHGYFGLDQERLWPIIRDEVPTLLAAVQEELGLQA
jgi:uncharacterized protein with HEPN domain